MANETINDQSALTSLATDDTIAVWDTSASAQKKIAFANFMTGSFDLGSGNYLAAEKLRARSSAGLRLEDDAGNLGIYIQDGGKTSVIAEFTVESAAGKGLQINPDFAGTCYFFTYDTPGATHIPFVIRANTLDLQTGTAATTSRFTISATGEIRGNYDTNTAAIFGRSRIGYDGSTSDWAAYSHVDMSGAANFALSQSPTGATWINAASGQQINFAVAGTPLGTWHATNGFRVGYDTNVTSVLGRAAVGYDGSTSDHATFAHVDMNSAANAALYQSPLGEVRLNAAAGQDMIFARGGTALGYWDTSSNFHPQGDNTQDCGKSGRRWNDIWAGNATIQTSDEREKVNVKASDLGLDFIRALEPISWVWANVDKPAVTETRTDGDGNEYEQIIQPAIKTDYKRPHYGLSAQQVKATMDALGVPDFAGYIHDSETGEYALRYSEFIAPIVKAIQELADQVASLKPRAKKVASTTE